MQYNNIMPVKVDKILGGFEPYTETAILLLGSAVVASKSKKLLVSGVAIAPVSILIIMLNMSLPDVLTGP